MSLLIGFLTFILVVNCVLLGLLVLIQLPKKEAGAGLAFGGGATDALFGAGSGNALTKMTRYAATTFLVLALILTILNTRRVGSSVREIEAILAQREATSGVPAAVQQVLPPATNQQFQGLTPLPDTNVSSPQGNILPLTTNSAAPAPATQPANSNPTAAPAGQQP